MFTLKNFQHVYYNKTVSVAGGVTDQEVDIAGTLSGLLARWLGPARYLEISSDVTVTVKINSASADAITITGAAAVRVIPLGLMGISKLYLTSSAICGGAVASVKIFAA